MINLVYLIMLTSLVFLRPPACWVFQFEGRHTYILDSPNGICDPLLNGNSEKHQEKNKCPYGKATFLQLVTFSWLNQLFTVGKKKPLNQDDVPDVDTGDSAEFLSHSFDEKLKFIKEKDGTTNPSIYKAIYMFIRKKAAMNALFVIISVAASYVGPYLIDDLVTYLNEKKTRSLGSGFLLALAFLSAKVVKTITQRRIQIARAVYQDADIYLLDDPFSAVDAHTGRQLFEECLMGILKEKTIVYVTHQVEFLTAADLILVMQNGRIAQAGSFEELLKQNIGFEVLVGAHSQALDSVLTVETSSRASQHAKKDGELTTESTSIAEFPYAKQESEHNLCNEITEMEGKLVNEEEREKGSIGKEVYLAYLTIVKGGALVPLIVLAQSSFQVLQIASNYWMAWACPTDEAEPVTGMNFILLIYILFSVGSSLCVLVRASLLAIAGRSIAEKLFHNMLHSVLRDPMAFLISLSTVKTSELSLWSYLKSWIFCLECYT